MRGLALITLTLTALTTSSLRAQAPGEDGGLQARVWLDRGTEPVLRRGETVRIFYRVSEGAYAAIFRIDTDGRISLVYPQDPTMEERLAGGVDYRLIFQNAPIWRVSEDPGVGYFFMVASRQPLDFSAFPFDPRYGWDLDAVGRVVYEDPYVAIDDYVAELIPDWEQVPYALDFITYNVGDTYTYPRFLCYDCHDARPYAAWNPYAVPCTTYRVVVYDDPYFYPYYRYSGMTVVVARPPVTQPRYAVAVRAPGDSYRPIIRTRTPPPRRSTAEFKEAPAEAGPSGAVPRRLSQDDLPPSRRPTLDRRPTAPSSRLPVRTPPDSRGGDGSSAPSTRGRSDPTIVRPARPSTPSASPGPSRPSDRVSPTPRGGASPGTRPSAGTRPPTQSRPSTTRPSTRSRPSTTRPTRPSTPTRASPTRPSTPSRATPRPTAPSRPNTTPSRGGSTRAAPSRPTAPPPAGRPSTRPAPRREPSRPSTRPSGSGRSSSPPSRPSRPTVRSRSPSTGRR